jgi:hypothetical protein
LLTTVERILWDFFGSKELARRNFTGLHADRRYFAFHCEKEGELLDFAPIWKLDCPFGMAVYTN